LGTLNRQAIDTGESTESKAQKAIWNKLEWFAISWPDSL